MIRLNKTQLAGKVKFITDYINASNAADGSTFDPNANVSSKNVATLSAELNKDINIQIKRKLIYDILCEQENEKLADKYIEQLEKHEIYCHDETATVLPYCVSISMYPFLQNGLQDFGGESKAPKHLSSFNGGFVNLVFAISSQFAGAVATVEYLNCFDFYARKDYGDNYLENYEHIIVQELQQIVYALNQPASARGYQSPFWNISIYDKYYFESLFSNFYFPDGSKPNWESLNKLQKFFMKWFNKEREKALLTFPVVTVAGLDDGEKFRDEDFEDFLSEELSEGNSFFIFRSDRANALSSCCRLQLEIDDSINDFSYSLGAGGVMAGSVNVLTLNVNRFVQDVYREWGETLNFETKLYEGIAKQITTMNKYQLAFRTLFKRLEAKGLLPAYTAGFIQLDKQYLTIGLNGVVEAAEFLGYEISDNKEYKEFLTKFFKTINETNKEFARNTSSLKINTEQVPAENLGNKFAQWDKKDSYVVPRDVYNSYLYIVEDENLTILDKLKLHGKQTTKYLNGGSAVHLNLEDYPTKETCKKLIRVAIKEGCPYFCFNVKVTICNDCSHIDKQTNRSCTKCGSKNIDYATRVIGYLRRVTNFSKERQTEEQKRYYHNA